MSSTVTLGDLALTLGVSKTLISLVLNNKGTTYGISQATQKKVFKLAKKLNYQPNLVARGLREGKTNTVGLVVSDIANPFYSKMARHIEDFLSAKDYHLVICSTDEEPEREHKIIKLMREKQFDGIIVSTSQRKTGDFKQLMREKYPFVLIDRKIKSIKTNFIGINNFQATYQAVKYLIGEGYSQIAAMAVSPVYVSSIKERIKGYRHAMADSGFDLTQQRLVEIPFDKVKTAVKTEIQKLIQSPHPVNALFAINNNIAVACLEAFRELQIALPKDIAFIAFDDIDAFRLTTPTVTAIDQPLEEICQHAVDILLNEIARPRRAKKEIILSPSLIIRQSVKKL
ncbi:MAG: LacI family DNA-binding transcriptional regulator [Bacteroidota bacterium]